jgi:hypothetical protein
MKKKFVSFIGIEEIAKYSHWLTLSCPKLALDRSNCLASDRIS